MSQQKKNPDWKQCEHGKCLHHQPDWEVIEKKFVPYPLKFLFLDIRTVNIKCCDQKMSRMRLMRVLRCKKCGAKTTELDSTLFAQCECCGRQLEIRSCDIY